MAVGLTKPTGIFRSEDLVKSRIEDDRHIDSVSRDGHQLALTATDDPSGRIYEIRMDGAFRADTRPVSWMPGLVERLLSGGGRSQELHVLIRGIGTGASLRNVLALSTVASVTVVEPESALVRWNRRQFGNRHLVEDARVTVVVGSFVEYLQGAPRSYDGLLLDYTASLWDGPRELSLTTLGRLATRVRPTGSLALITPKSSSESQGFKSVLEEALDGLDDSEVAVEDSSGERFKSLVLVSTRSHIDDEEVSVPPA